MMSLFSILKYPISYPPRYEELLKLPEDFIKKWTQRCVGSEINSLTMCQTLHRMSEEARTGSKADKDALDDCVKMLREMIFELDE
jgi:hypothetical protein